MTCLGYRRPRSMLNSKALGNRSAGISSSRWETVSPSKSKASGSTRERPTRCWTNCVSFTFRR